MQSETAAQEDRTASLTSDIRPSMPWRVREVTAQADYRLLVTSLMACPGSWTYRRSLRHRTLVSLRACGIAICLLGSISSTAP